MAGRTVGEGRTVMVGGRTYTTGDSIPADVQVDDRIFTDKTDVEGNVALGPNVAGGAHRPTGVAASDFNPDADDDGSGGASGPADGTIDEVLDRVGTDADAAREALAAEEAKSKPRATLLEKLQAIVNGS